MAKVKKRVVTFIKWDDEARETDLNKDPDRYCGKESQAESIYVEKFAIESVPDFWGTKDEEPAKGKFVGEFVIHVYGNHELVGVKNRVERRLQLLQNKKILSGFYFHKFGGSFYFNPVKHENFTRTALKVAAEFFEAFGIDSCFLPDFEVSQETQVWYDDEWNSFEDYLEKENSDILKSGRLVKN